MRKMEGRGGGGVVLEREEVGGGRDCDRDSTMII